MDAVDDLSDAFVATRTFLTPVRAGLWLRLALVVFFVGGLSSGGPPAGTGNVGPVTEGPGPGTGIEPGFEQLPDTVLLIVALAVVGLFVLWLAFSFVAAIMEFVFVESLRAEAVHVRRYGRENVGRGVRLFLFRLALGLGTVLVGLGPLAFVFLTTGGLEAAAVPVVLAGLVAFLAFVVYAVVTRFTTEFVVPVMLLEERGVLGAWGRFWSTLRSNVAEYAVYLLLVWIVQVAVGIAVGFLLVVAGVVLAIPFAIAIGGALLLLGEAGVFVAIPVGLLGLLAFVLLALLIQIPVSSYFRYYALLLLGDTDPALDLVPDQRAAIRSDGGDSTGGPGGDESTGPGDRRDGGDSATGDRDDGTTDEEPWVDDLGETDERGDDRGR